MTKYLFLAPMVGMLVAAAPIAFPDTSKSHRNGPDRPLAGSISRITSGMTKSQVSRMLGNPHFSEGLGAKYWHYWLAYGAEQCRLRIHFDKGRVAAKSWDKAQCETASG